MMNFAMTRLLVPVVAALLVTTGVVACSGTGPVDSDAMRVHTVVIKQFKFMPEVLNVRPGDKIVWINQDIVPHTATALDKSWDTGTIGSEERREMMVEAGQSTRYFCDHHPVMTAQLEFE